MGVKSGQCLCGAVKFTAAPKDSDVGVCHCSMCRRGTAGPYFAIDCGESLKFENEEKLGVYVSSDWAERGFCTQCGSPLFWRTKDRKTNIVSINAFDNVDDLRLDHEVFIDEKPGYYAFSQDTKQMTGAEVFAMFASGETEA